MLAGSIPGRASSVPRAALSLGSLGLSHRVGRLGGGGDDRGPARDRNFRAHALGGAPGLSGLPTSADGLRVGDRRLDR